MIRPFIRTGNEGQMAENTDIQTDIQNRFPMLFSPFAVGRCRLKNRIVALPVHTGFAYPDGRISPLMRSFYRRIAESGAAMVVVANAAVSKDGLVSGYNLRADDDAFTPGLSRLAETIHRAGAIACLQLNHGGMFATAHRPLLPSPMDGSNLAFNLTSLKDFMHQFPFEKRFGLTRKFLQRFGTWRRSMDDAAIHRVTRDFAESAVRARAAGFDMVELHGANGYLLCQFLSPFTNRRSGEFGGAVENRAAFPLKVIDAVRGALPEYFPVGYRLLLREWVPGGIDMPEATAFARLMEAKGIAYISVSAGSYHSLFSPEVVEMLSKPGYLEADTATLTAALKTPTVISGRITTPALAESLLVAHTADLIGIGRPLRTDSDWIRKARNGSGTIVRCVNCNTCLKRVIQDQGFVCRMWSKTFQEKTALEHRLLKRNRRILWILCDRTDLALLPRAIACFLPPEGGEPAPSLTFLLVTRNGDPEGLAPALNQQLAALGDSLSRAGYSPEAVHAEVRFDAGDGIADTVRHEVERRQDSLIFIARHSGQNWRPRLFYKVRGRAVALIGKRPDNGGMLIPVDLSDATLLQLAFFRTTYTNDRRFHPTFLHILSGSEAAAEKQWRRITKIAGLNGLPLMFLPDGESTGRTIVNAVETGGFDTILMGKRGLSGIKRWLLGSVSADVLSRLRDQSLFLID